MIVEFCTGCGRRFAFAESAGNADTLMQRAAPAGAAPTDSSRKD
jgi:hypothetical protein